MKKSIILLFGLLLFNVLPNKAQELIEFSGRVVNQNFDPVEDAVIRITGTGMGTISSFDGRFFLPLQKGDTLLITHLSFLPEIYVVAQSDSSQKTAALISLRKTVYELESVDILPWPETFQEFKNAFARLRLEEEKMVELNIPGVPKNIPKLSDDRFGVTAMGPVQLVYNLFSKDVKRKKRFYKNVQREKRYDRIRMRYNPELVSRISGLHDPLKIDKLMKFCALDDQFVLQATDYDIYFAIFDCWKDYSASEKTDSLQQEP